MQKLACRLAAIAALTLSSLAAHADTVYTYTGNTFTSSSAPYTSSDSVTGSFTVAAPLAGNLVVPSAPGWISNIDWTSFIFSDGVDTITNLTADPTFRAIEVGTDSSGNITSWLINIYTPSSSTEIYTALFTANVEDFGSSVSGAVATNFSDSGSWSSNAPTNTTLTPEPSTIALLGTGLVGMCGMIRRRVRI